MGQRVKFCVNRGEAAFIHSDAAVDLLRPLGQMSMRRASHVEPWPSLSQQAQLQFLVDQDDRYLKPQYVADWRDSSVCGLRHLIVPELQHYDTSELQTLWFADLSPVGGRTAGPFRTKQEALDHEVAWIESNVLHVRRTDSPPA